MDRAEKAGLGVAIAGHAALLAAISLGFANAKLPPIQSPPIEVDIVDQVAPESTAPNPAQAEPAPKLAEEAGPPEPSPPPPEAAPPSPPPASPPPRPIPPPPQPAPAPRAIQPPKPVPAPRPVPAKPAPPRPEARPAPARPAPSKPAPPRPQPSAQKPAAKPAQSARPSQAPAQRNATGRPTGRLTGLLTGLSDRESESKSDSTPAAKAGPAVQASLAAEVRRQLKPHWRAPTGADSELLRTVVEVHLAKDGSIIGQPEVVEQKGVTASNRAQAGLHKEQAIKAVKLAAPFRLPAEYYDSWKVILPVFDKRLSQ